MPHFQGSRGTTAAYFLPWCFTHQYKYSVQFRIYATSILSQNTKRQEIAVFKTSVSKNITAGSWGFWHEKITIPSGYKILYVSATFDNADKCMLTPYSSSVVVVGTSKDIEPYFGFCAQSTGTGTFTVYAVCIKSD